MRLSPAALLGLAVALAPTPALRAGEAAPQKGATPAVHWTFPRQLAVQQSAARRGYQAFLSPTDLVRTEAGALAFVGQSADRWGSGAGVLQACLRPGQGLWQEVESLPSGSLAAAPIPVGRDCALLTSTINSARRFGMGGEEGGIQLSIVPMEAGGKVRTSDVPVTRPRESKLGMNNDYVQLLGATLAAKDKEMLCAFWLQRNDLAGPVSELCLRTSGDGGTSWKELSPLASVRDARADGVLAAWAAADGFHLLYSPPPAKPGDKPPPARHAVSADGTGWKDGSPLLPEKAGDGAPGALYPVLALARGLEVFVLAGDQPGAYGSGGRIWLVRSPDGGASWKAPRRVADRRGRTPLAGQCRLSAGDGVLVCGLAWSDDQGKPGGECLVSRDDGESWQKLDFAAGLAGRAFSPCASVEADGSILVVFGWQDEGATESAVLSRIAGTGPEPGPSEKDSAAIAGLVRDLASDDWRVREKAAAGLRQWGPAALPALREAAKDGDAERSLAAGELLKNVRPPWIKD